MKNKITIGIILLVIGLISIWIIFFWKNSSNQDTQLSSCSGAKCPVGYTCFASKYMSMGPDGLVEGEEEGDLLCHKQCDSDADCNGGKCLIKDLKASDLVLRKSMCF